MFKNGYLNTIQATQSIGSNGLHNYQNDYSGFILLVWQKVDVQYNSGKPLPLRHDTVDMCRMICREMELSAAIIVKSCMLRLLSFDVHCTQSIIDYSI